MNFTSFLNVSNVDNINCDSGFIFQRQLGSSLIELGHKFTLIIPCKVPESNIDYIYYDFGSNKFEVRYSFNWKNALEIISATKPNVILSNQPELSANIKALVTAEGINALVCTYIHYFPFSLDDDENIIYDVSLNNFNICESIILAFISGLIASDQIMVHSEFSIKLLAALFRKYNIQLSRLKITILSPPCDKHISGDTNIKLNSTDILYNHRLYSQYGTDFLIQFAEIAEKRFNWQITITDLLYNRNTNRIILDNSVDNYRRKLMNLKNVKFRNDGDNRDTYKQIINSSKIGLAPYRKNCTWSMSVIDCMSAGVPVVAPNFAWFKEFIPNELLFNSLEEMNSIISHLLNNTQLYSVASEKVRNVIKVKNDLSETSVAIAFAENFRK